MTKTIFICYTTKHLEVHSECGNGLWIIFQKIISLPDATTISTKCPLLFFGRLLFFSPMIRTENFHMTLNDLRYDHV